MFINRFNNIFLNKNIIFKSYYHTSNDFNLKYIFNLINKNYNYTFVTYSTNSNKLTKSDYLINKDEDSPITFEDSEVIKCTKDQWLYKPTAREIKLFLESKMIPTKPFDLENSVVVKLVDLNKDVSSPVKSTVYYSEYGIRKGERLKLCLIWALVCSLCGYLGYWQLKRRKWKEDLITKRQKSLNMPILKIESLSDLKLIDILNQSDCLSTTGSTTTIGTNTTNTTSTTSGSTGINNINNLDNNNNKEKEDNSEQNNENINNNIENDLSYRVIEAKGVLDTKEQFLVGPRQSLTHDYGDQIGYYVIYPLRFSDGSSILVNMGWLKGDDVFDMNVSSEWVTVRGVLVSGEISENLLPSFKHKLLNYIEKLSKNIFNKDLNLTKRINRVSRLIRNDQRKVYRYLDPESIGSQIFSNEPELTQKYMLNVYDSYFDEDKPILVKETDDYKSRLINRLIRVSGIRPLESFSPIKSNDKIDTNRKSPPRYDFQRKQKSDYLLFYADPGTHFNYAMQWFLMGFSISAMCIYKLIKVNRIIKSLNF